MDSNYKVLIPLIRRVVPNLIAHDLVSVQPMSDPFRMYSVVEKRTVNGKDIYSVVLDDKIWEWMKDTYVEGKDYTVFRRLKGVWVDIGEDLLVMLKLKWS